MSKIIFMFLTFPLGLEGASPKSSSTFTEYEHLRATGSFTELGVEYEAPQATSTYIYTPTEEEAWARKLVMPSTSASAASTEREWETIKETIPPELKDIVVHEGKALMIKKGDRILAEFHDKIYETPDYDSDTYIYEGFSKKNGCLWIFVYSYENSDVILINYTSGEKTKISSVPIWSPSQSRFVTIFTNIFGGGEDAAVEIWHIEKGGFVKKLESSRKNSGMILGSAEWLSEDEIEFINDGGDEIKLNEGLNCKFGGDKWSCKRFKKPAEETVK